VSSLRALLFAALLGAAASEGLVDPTAPPAPVVAHAQSGGPKLQGILHQAGRDVAVIDGARVVAGDSVAGWRVVLVGADAVKLASGGRSLELRLAPSVRREATIRGGKP
jgi:hypothetical protein